jgi:hypothetical protein
LNLYRCKDDVFIDCDKNLTKDNYYEVLDTSTDGKRYKVVDDIGRPAYYNTYHFEKV